MANDEPKKGAAEALAAGHRMAAEGFAMVEATIAVHDLKVRRDGHHGPLMRSWLRGEFHRPKPEAKPPAGEYGFLTIWDTGNVDAVRCLLKLAKVTDKPKAYYRDAGQHLARLRFRSAGKRAVERGGFEWTELVKHECGISARYARELIAIWTGEKPYEALRAEKTARGRKYRARQIKDLEA